MKKTPFSLMGMFMLIIISAGCQKLELENPTPKEALEIPLTETATTSTAITKYIRVNVFGGSNAYANAQWNNWNSASASTKFKYSDGTISSIVATLSQQSGVSDNGANYTATVAPNEVIRYGSYSTSNRTLTITGLDNAKSYSLELYAARSGVTNNTTRFAVGTTSIDIKTDNNTANKAVFTALAPSAGKITVNISKLNTYNYLNGFTLTEKSITTSTDSLVVTQPVTSTSGCNTAASRVFTLSANSSGEIYIPDASSRGWKGGDTLRIPTGTYSLIHIGNFKGDACRPIVIINYGGQVKASQMRFVNDAAYFKLTGSGHAATTYGFRISSTANSGVAMDLAHHVEVERVEVTGTEVGFYFKKNPSSTDPKSYYPNYVLSNFYIHHNYIHNVRGEGMYIGHTYPSADPYHNNLIPIRMDRVEIAYNTVDGTDWDGIQLSNARSGAKIHHNTVTNFGRIKMSSQQAGIILGGNTTGDVYDNVVKNGTGNGIQLFGYGTIRVYNNQVEGAGNDGTSQGQESVFANDHVNSVESNPKQQILFYNNIIKYPKPKGAIRVGAYNNNSLASQITKNTIYLPNAPTNWQSLYLVTNAAGSTIADNTLIK